MSTFKKPGTNCIIAWKTGKKNVSSWKTLPPRNTMYKLMSSWCQFLKVFGYLCMLLGANHTCTKLRSYWLSICSCQFLADAFTATWLVTFNQPKDCGLVSVVWNVQGRACSQQPICFCVCACFGEWFVQALNEHVNSSV